MQAMRAIPASGVLGALEAFEAFEALQARRAGGLKPTTGRAAATATATTTARCRWSEGRAVTGPKGMPFTAKARKIVHIAAVLLKQGVTRDEVDF